MMLLITRSKGMLVKSDVASKEIKISNWPIPLTVRVLYKSKLLLTCLSLKTKLLEIILHKKKPKDKIKSCINGRHNDFNRIINFMDFRKTIRSRQVKVT